MPFLRYATRLNMGEIKTLSSKVSPKIHSEALLLNPAKYDVDVDLSEACSDAK